MSTVLITPPSVQPVSVAEMKNTLKLEDSETDDDALLAGLIRSAVEYAEMYQNRRLMTQTWDLKLDGFPCGAPEQPWSQLGRPWSTIEIPFAPLQSVTSITYTDNNGTTQTWSSSLYTVLKNGLTGRVVPAYQQVYPSTRAVPESVTVRFVCGYGDNPGNVPERTRWGIQLLVKQWYDKRGENEDMTAINNLLYPDRVLSL